MLSGSKFYDLKINFLIQINLKLFGQQYFFTLALTFSVLAQSAGKVKICEKGRPSTLLIWRKSTTQNIFDHRTNSYSIVTRRHFPNCKIYHLSDHIKKIIEDIGKLMLFSKFRQFLIFFELFLIQKIWEISFLSNNLSSNFPNIWIYIHC